MNNVIREMLVAHNPAVILGATSGEFSKFMGRQPKEHTATNPTQEQLRRGKAFASWFQRSLAKASENVYSLSLKPGMKSTTYLYMLKHDGLIKRQDGTIEYKRPSEDVVREIATALGADVSEGLKAAGYDPHAEVPTLTSGLANLPLHLQHDLADLIRNLQQSVIKETAVNYSDIELMPTDFVTLPIIGDAGAVGDAFDIVAEESIEGELTLPSTMIKNNPAERCFIIRVRGNCLEGSAILNGDYAVCVAADTAQDGQIVAVIDGEKRVLKRYREEVTEKEGTQCWLETDEANGEHRLHQTEYPPRIMGRMIALHREL